MNSLLNKCILMYGFLAILSTTAHSSLAIASPCPVNFIGQVKHVIRGPSPNDPLVKDQVVFSAQSDGKDDVVKIFSFLRHGPIQFQEGKEYKVWTNSGKLCMVESM